MSIELLVMLERLELLGYFDGLQFYCEARAENLSTEWVKEILSVYAAKCSQDFKKGVSDAATAEEISKLEERLSLLI